MLQYEEYLIELKDSHIMSAFVQLKNTDKKLTNALKDHILYWRFVFSSRMINLKYNDVKKISKKSFTAGYKEKCFTRQYLKYKYVFNITMIYSVIVW